VTQALHISNGDTINQKLTAKENAISRALTENKPVEELIDEIYLSTLSRLPSPPERERMVKVFAEGKAEKRAVLEDAYWALLSSKEFLFNH
jgi:hypothetical protein